MGRLLSPPLSNGENTMEKTAKKRSQAAIDRLKQAWIKDPSWNIYDVEGFEAHREELEAYQKEMEKNWEQEIERKKREKSLKQRKDLYGLDLGQTTEIGGRLFVRVPGGWVMEKTEISGVCGEINSVAAVFIPLSNEFQLSFFNNGSEQNV
ncbi:hypothetical protein [Microbulbifer sp. JMSA008]|uniref:hypothetical protein n=1 Tax=Microbulbifer sp. JMSA008 TaxID=3243373 RepID=UPI0040390607